MADSIDPAGIPPVYAAMNNGVLAYANGPHAWSPAQLARWPRKHHITVNPVNYVPEAWRSMFMDVENFDCVPSSVPPWFEKRRAKAGAAALIAPYCSRDSVKAVCDAMTAAGHDYNELVWGIATLDNDGTWTAERMAADLSARFDAHIRAARIWGIQWLRRDIYDGWTVCRAPVWSTL
jgi:hypothetical protein